MQSQWIGGFLMGVIAVNTLLWVWVDMPYRLQLVHWCDTAHTCLLASLLCCQSFLFLLIVSEICPDPQANQSRENRFYLQIKDILWWKGETLFSTSISHQRLIFLAWVLILKWEHLWLLFYFVGSHKFFFHWVSLFTYLVIWSRCSVTLLIPAPAN